MRLPLAAMLLLTACSGRDTTTTGERAAAPLEPITRDSAGITILEHPDGALDRLPSFTRDTAPMLTISGGDDDDLSRVRSAAFTSDGGLVYYDQVASSVVFVAPDGMVRRRSGRAGSGPGEFGRFGVSVAVLPGDSVVVTDASNARLTVLHADTGVVRMVRWQSRIGGHGYVVDGALGDGRWLARPSSFLVAGPGAPEPGDSGAAFVGALRPVNDSVALDTMLTIRVPAFVGMAYWSDGKKQEGVGSALYQLMPGAVTWRGEAVTWRNDAWELIRRDATTGAVRAIHRLVNGAPPPPPDTRDSLVAQATRTGASSDGPSEDPEAQRADSRRTAMEMPIADRISPFAAVRTGAGRLLWVEAQVPAWVDSALVTAIDPEGRLVGGIRLPAPYRVLAIADDRVALREEDDDGVVSIRVYRLKNAR